MDKKEFKTLSSDIVFKSIFFKNNDLLEWLMNRTFKSLNINYNILTVYCQELIQHIANFIVLTQYIVFAVSFFVK